VWALARHLGVPREIVDKPASADLVQGQTDEGDFGIRYARADELLNWLLSGYAPEELVARGHDAAEVELVRKRLAGTHWKRRLPGGGDDQPHGHRRGVSAAGRLLTTRRRCRSTPAPCGGYTTALVLAPSGPPEDAAAYAAYSRGS
jgi:hypothetical protein